MENGEQSQEHAHPFLDIKGIVHKEFILAGQPVNSEYYCDFYGDSVKMCEDFAKKFGKKGTRCFIMIMYRLKLPFSPGKF
jgi:hypothetical protein